MWENNFRGKLRAVIFFITMSVLFSVNINGLMSVEESLQLHHL
jgi:hypothetical protein